MSKKKIKRHSRSKRNANEQARLRMARFRKRQRVAWNIVTQEKELKRLTPRARKAIRAAMGI